jgi:hypothetical protein
VNKPPFISVDELRALGALDVPPAWRKSLSAGVDEKRDLFSDLGDDDNPSSAEGLADDEPSADDQ